MNTNNKNTKMGLGLLILSSLVLTGCGEVYDETVKTGESVRISTVGQAQEADRILKEKKIQAIHAEKDKQISEIKVQLKEDKVVFTREIESELTAKQAFLSSKTKDEIKKLKAQAEQDQTAAIIAVEREISAIESKTESELVKKILDNEIKNVSNLIQENMKLQVAHNKEVAGTEAKLKSAEQKRLATLEKNIVNAKKYNQDLLDLKAAELERIRLEAAMSAKQKAVAKNDAIITDLRTKYESELAKRVATVKKTLGDNKKAVLGKLDAKFEATKTARESANKKRQQTLSIKNEQVKKEAGDKKRSSLALVRKSKITSIQNKLKTNIAKSKTNEKRVFADFKANLDTKLFASIKNIEDISLQKSKHVYEQAQKAEQRVIDEYNEKKRITAKILNQL